MPSVNKYSFLLLAAVIYLINLNTSHASPWLESDDPFIRADLQLLADAGLLEAPINNYPLRWSTFGDDVKYKQAKPATHLAKNHINYMLTTAKTQRSRNMTKAILGNAEPVNTGFGQSNKNEWGVYASSEQTFGDFSFRINSSYSKEVTASGSENNFLWDGSYLALNAGQWLFTVGVIDRWWGPSWQHNLSTGNYGQANPSVSVSYLGDKLPLLGYWSAESVIELLNEDFKYLSSSRVMVKPLKFIELGATYQTTEKNNVNTAIPDNTINKRMLNYGIDGRLSLPNILNVYHGFFISYQSMDYLESASANIIGWDGQFNFYDNSVRLVIEKQTVTDENGVFSLNKANTASQPFNTNSVSWGDSSSVAFYFQFLNDHKMSIVYRNSNGLNEKEEQTIQLDYRIPLAKGQWHIGLGQTNNKLNSTVSSTISKTESSLDENDIGNEFNVWSGYELRF